jgi:hypothetical protein
MVRQSRTLKSLRFSLNFLLVRYDIFVFKRVALGVGEFVAESSCYIHLSYQPMKTPTIPKFRLFQICDYSKILKIPIILKFELFQYSEYSRILAANICVI